MLLSSRLPSICSWILLIALLVGLSILLRTHSAYVAAYPAIVSWFVLTPAAAFLLFFTNAARLSVRGMIAHFGFGLLATLAAFVLQAAVNGWLLKVIGDKGFAGAMLLGFGSGFSQSLAKYGFIAIAAVCLVQRDSPPLLAAAFGIGFGFGITEALLIAVQMVLTGERLTDLLGIVERCAAIWFHLCSCGLIAAGLILRDFKPILVVVLLHTLMDGLSVYFAPRAGFTAIQCLFWGIATTTWLVWMFAKSRLADVNHGDVAKAQG